MLSSCDIHEDFGSTPGPAAAFRIDFANPAEVPYHRHRPGQLILAIRGAVTCSTHTDIWIVPPGSAVWIPGGVSHSNEATANAKLVYLFVEPDVTIMPDECCALSVSPMLREMILRIADIPDRHAPDDHTKRLMRVALEELSLMPRGGVDVPISAHPKIAVMASALARHPDNRRTLREWSAELAMSERSLKRLITKETGLSFGRWRQRLHMVVAMRALASGASVKKVAADLGYESVTAFIVMFKKAVGATPGRYQEQAI